MAKALLPALLLVALPLAGCSGDDDHADADPFTCPDGQVVTPEQIDAHEGHHEEGFDPATLCPAPPQVLLTGLPASVGAHRTASFTWVVDNGSVPKGHSMLTSIRYGTASVPDAELTAPDKYPSELIKKEHQDLPVTFAGNLSFATPGKMYLRAYAQVQGEGVARKDYFSAEVVLDVLPVEPTGTTHTVTHGPGLVAAEVTPAEVAAVLGDTLAFANEDVVPHSLALQSGPSGATCTEVPEDGSCLLDVPGNYEFRTDGQQPKTVLVTVTVPA